MSYFDILYQVHADNLRVGKFFYQPSAEIVLGILSNHGYTNVEYYNPWSTTLEKATRIGWESTKQWSTAHFHIVGDGWLCDNADTSWRVGKSVADDDKPHCDQCERKYRRLYEDIVQGLNSNFEELVIGNLPNVERDEQ